MNKVKIVNNRNLSSSRGQSKGFSSPIIKRSTVVNSTRKGSVRSNVVPRNGINTGLGRRSNSKTISTRKLRIKNKSELLFAIGLFSILLAKLFVRISIIETSYQIENVRNELLAEDAKLRELRVKKAMLANPRELAKLADAKLKMRPTLPQQIRRITYGSSSM